MNTQQELKPFPCAFCGNLAFIDRNRGYRSISNGNYVKAVSIQCDSCQAEMTLCREDAPESMTTEDIVQLLLGMWNRRAEIQDDQEVKTPDTKKGEISVKLVYLGRGKPDPIELDEDHRDGNWMGKHGACKVCDGEIPYGHTSNCDVYKLEQRVSKLLEAATEIYNHGYMHGHEDSVESRFTSIHKSDMKTIHADCVVGVLQSLNLNTEEKK